ncbi:MAG: hypothetical protein JWM23_564 [Microbacteriaceae bacterium]|nr:hypothetical protein [Microbacteriaceae bacterium]
MTVADAAQVIGTLVAALIGVAGLAGVLWIEQRTRYKDALDAALAEVMRAFARRATDLEIHRERKWGAMGLRFPDAPGGPLDADMQSAIEIAWMVARGRDRPVLKSLGDATYALKMGLVSWQIGMLGPLAMDIRRWRTDAIDRAEFIRIMNGAEEAAKSSRDFYLAKIAQSAKKGD